MSKPRPMPKPAQVPPVSARSEVGQLAEQAIRVLGTGDDTLALIDHLAAGVRDAAQDRARAVEARGQVAGREDLIRLQAAIQVRAALRSSHPRFMA